MLVALYLSVSLVRCMFSGGGPPAPPEGHPAPPGLTEQFAGQYVSDTGRTKYEVNAGERRFSFYTTVGTRLLLQTQMAPFELREMDAAGSVVELLGNDQQAGGAPAARFRITRDAGGIFKLERIKPVGGSLGEFSKLP